MGQIKNIKLHIVTDIKVLIDSASTHMSAEGSIGLRIESFTDVDNRPGWCTSNKHIEYTDKTNEKSFIIRHWSTISRALSLIIVAVLWFMSLFLLEKENKTVGIYVVFAVTVVTFFETMFICHRLCCSDDRKDT